MATEALELRPFDERDREEVARMVHAFRDSGKPFLEHYEVDWNRDDAFTTFLGMVRDHEQGRSLPEGWVPASWFGVFLGRRLIGWLSIRHRLTDALREFGGHVGYGLHPDERGKGYGTVMLALGLVRARALGLDRVLITCDPENIPSARVIEKNGGVFDSESPTVLGRMTRRYWIQVPPKTETTTMGSPA